MEEVRRQHYLYAHRLLPQLFFQDPVRFLSILESDGDALLWSEWLRVGEYVGLEPGQEVPSDLSYEIRRCGNEAAVALITLPLPNRRTEPFYVAAALRTTTASEPEVEPPLQAHYVTLEYSIGVDGAPITMLCQWTRDGVHQNHGRGPEPVLDSFFDVVCKMIAG